MFRKKLRYILPRLGRFRYYGRIRIFGFDRQRKIKRTLYEKLKLVMNTESETVIPFIDIDVTTHCNLRCKRCAKCIPYYREKRHMPPEEIRENLDLLTKYVDRICVGSIIGGEPFLNPQLAEIIRICASYEKIEHLEVTTNGTIIPDDETLCAIRDSGASVHLSEYEHIDARHIETREKLREKLREYGIFYVSQFHPEWLDFGEIEKRAHSRRELDDMFIHCTMNSCSIYNNKTLYRCGRASYLAQHGIESGGDDVIRFDEIKSREEAKEKIRKFFAIRHLPACSYCERKPATIISGEQLPPVR